MLAIVGVLFYSAIAVAVITAHVVLNPHEPWWVE